MGCIESKQNDPVDDTQGVQVGPVDNTQGVQVGRYTFEDLVRMTDNFSRNREIGRGAFGVVYQGTRSDGGFVAVKQLLNSPSIDNITQFKKKVTNLKGLKHPNIVKLRGYCEGTHHTQRVGGSRVNGQKSLLYFEHLSTGSLDKKLLENRTRGFDWGERFKIIKGISSGLCFLHKKRKNGPIMHLDLKPSNILLDDSMTPKIADFGLSRLFGRHETRTITTNFVKSRPYMAPEYLQGGDISEAADVFSFGIIILEVITGKSMPLAPNLESTNSSIEKYTTEVNQDWSTQIRSRYPSPDCHKEVIGCIKIGLQCAEVDHLRRPNAEQIEYVLHNLSELKDGQNFFIDESSRMIGNTLSGRAVNGAMGRLLAADATSSSTYPVSRSRFQDAPVCLRSNSFDVTGEIPTKDLYHKDATYQVYLVYRFTSRQNRQNTYKSKIKLPGGEVVESSVCLDNAPPRRGAVPNEDMMSHVTRSERRGDDDWTVKLGVFRNGSVQADQGAVVIAGVYDIDIALAESLIILGMEFTPRRPRRAG